jgi:hypothetical protein
MIFLIYLVLVSLSFYSSSNALHIQHMSRHIRSQKYKSLSVSRNNVLKSKVESVVVNSPVLDFAPWLELHHIVLLKDKSNPGIVCAIDFSPLDQTNPNTITKLLLGKSVPAEIRVNWLAGKLSIRQPNLLHLLTECYVDFDGKIDSVKTLAINSSKLSSNLLKRYKTPPRQAAPELVDFVDTILKSWPSEMNFYSQNCQHFSDYVQRQMRSDPNRWW